MLSWVVTIFSISLLSLASFIVIAFIKICWLGIELANPFNSASDLEVSFNASKIYGVFKSKSLNGNNFILSSPHI